MFRIERDEEGWSISGRDFLNWFVPAMLALISAGIVMVWSRVGDVQIAQQGMSARITAIESSRFSSSDGLEVWQTLGQKVDREELAAELHEIKELIRDGQSN